MKKVILIGLLWPLLPPAQAQLPSVAVMEEQVRRANDYFIDNNSVGDGWWDRAAYAVGNVEAAKLLNLPAYWTEAEDWAIANNWGPTPPSSSNVLHADAHLAFQVYQDLYAHNPIPSRLTATRNTLQDLIDNVSWSDSRSVNNHADDDWWWIDAFYMAAPSLARMANLDNNEAFRTQMWDMYLWMKNTRGLFNPVDGLWYRDEAQFPPGKISPNGRSVYWSRGNGWVFMGLARVLEALPANHVYRPEFESMFQTMAAALKPRQGSDGFWRSNLLDNTPYPGPETSGTAFFTAGMAWGIRNGLLDDAEYGPIVELAWEGLSTLALQENGRVGYIQNIGFDPQPAGMNETHDFGVGAFLLAGVELIRLQGGPSPLLPMITGPNSLSLPSGQFETTVALHVNNSVLRSGSMQSATWWIGNIYQGQGLTTSLTLPTGTHDLRAELMHSNGQTYPAYFSVQVLAGGTQPQPILTASSWQDPNFPVLVLDHDLNTRWSAEGLGEWIQFDLGGEYLIDAVDIAFYLGDQRTSTFDLDFSIDGSLWQPILSSAASSGTSVELETFLTGRAPARYVRITGQGNSQSLWNSYTEVLIHPSTHLPVTAVSASASQNSSFTPDLVNDGDPVTRWSAEGLGQWIELDLGGVQEVNEVAISFYNGDQRQAYFGVEVSENGTDWTGVLSNQQSSGGTLDLERFAFVGQNARYVRITGSGNSQSLWNSYTEVEIHHRETDLVDGDVNGLPDAWEITHLGTAGQDANVLRAKGMSLMDDFIAGTDPTDPTSLPVVALSASAGGPKLSFHATAAFGPGYSGRIRWFQVEQSPSLTSPDWQPVPGVGPIQGDNLIQDVTLPTPEEPLFYRTRNWLE